MTEEEASALAVIATTADIRFWVQQNMVDGVVNALDLLEVLKAMQEDASIYI